MEEDMAETCEKGWFEKKCGRCVYLTSGMWRCGDSRRVYRRRIAREERAIDLFIINDTLVAEGENQGVPAYP